MKRVVTVVVCLLGGGLAMAAEDARDAATPLPSKISEVMVYADRARVTRQATLPGKAGPSLYAVQKLPGWIDESSVRVTLAPETAGKITDVQVKRSHLAQARDEELRKAESAVEEIKDQLAALNDEQAVLDAQKKQVENIRTFSMERLPADAALRDIKIETYAQAVKFVGDSLREIAAAQRGLAVKRRQMEPDLAARNRRLAELVSARQLEESTVLVAVEASAALGGTLGLTYMLPGATWEPAHELRTTGQKPENAQLLSVAIVTQTTGEDWSGVPLLFSTQSPGAVSQIPELDALLLGSVPAVGRMIRDQNVEAFRAAERLYKGSNKGWFNYVNPNQSDQVYEETWSQQAMVQTRTSKLFATLQKRGTTALFVGSGKPLIRSDGHPVRVPMGDAKLAAKFRIVAVPQASLNAARTLDMTNRSKQPLLPGQVLLYQDAAFLGTTDLDFVADGEDFSMFLGVADQVKLSRVMDKKDSSLVRGKRTRMQVAFELTVENLSDQPIALQLMDRVPVSENREIEIDKVRIQPEVTPDSKGLLKWEVALAAKGKQAFRIEYRIEYPPEVVERAIKAKTIESRSGVPADDLSIQIHNLESKF